MKILFVCTGNICRSATAELLVHAKNRPGVTARSAGVSAEDGWSCPPETLAALRRAGLDGRAHRARYLNVDMVREADLILGMTRAHVEVIARRHPEAKPKLRLFLEAAGGRGDVYDPYYGGPAEHRAMTEQVSAAVDKILDLFPSKEKRP